MTTVTQYQPSGSLSLLDELAALTPEQLDEALKDPTAIAAAEQILRTPWLGLARPEQLAPSGGWFVWLLLTGRGWGKTRTGAEFIRAHLLANPGQRAALVADTQADARDVMVEGESGLLAILRPEDLRGGSAETGWNRSMGELFLANGSQAKCYSAEKGGKLRGPQHHVAWCDEAAKWRDAKRGMDEDTTWSNLALGLRLGENPQCVVTTTPRNVKLIRQLVADEHTVVTRGTTYDNLRNLSPVFRAQVLSRYEGTRLGKQELGGHLLEDVEGALWELAWIEDNRVKEAPQLTRIVVAVDPSVSSGPDSAETGIVVVGLGEDKDWYPLADRSKRCSPDAWARRAVNAYHEFQADCIVAEVNNGGDLVESVLRTVDPTIPYRKVHAARGKMTRAEPISALYQQGRVHHVGLLPELEDQMCSYVPEERAPAESQDSPDRMDALVWGVTELTAATVPLNMIFV